MKLKNNALQELYDTVVNGTITISPYAESSIDKAFRECDEKIQKEIDIWNALEHEALSANKRLEEDISKLKEYIWDTLAKEEEDISKLKEHIWDTLAKERDDLLSRTHCAEDEVEALKEELMEISETLEKANTDRTELQNDRDFYHGLYTELRKDYDKLFEDNKKLNARTDCLLKEVELYRKHYRDQSDKIENLKKKLEYLTSQNQKLTMKNKRLQNNVRAGYDQGQTDLWVKLQDVKNMRPNEFDVECECLGDVIDMDLEDFLDAYKEWQEEKEKNRFDHMRDYLARFCEGRVCEACPLGSTKYKCGRGYSFKKATVWDSKIIPDEELEKYAEDLKAALASEVKEVPVSCDIPIKDLGSWECTLEATVEINNDLLEKVCGVKPKEEEHNLEYGDAVRLPWIDYDYMYIGPDEKEETLVHLFDTQNHAVVTTHISNVGYNGGKILVSEEDDIRKIWKYMK